MSGRNILGAVLGLIVFIGSFLLSGSASAYLNLAAFMVVVSGLIAGVMLSHPYERIRTAMHVARDSYRKATVTPSDIVRTLLDFSVRSKVDGVLSLEKREEYATSGFMKSGLILLVDNFKEEDIREYLNTEMHFFRHRRMQSEKVFRNLARMAPAFGVAGSVIGLIGLLMGINDPDVILRNIPVAFISTLYGLIFANLVFTPIAESISENTYGELLNQKLILEGCVAISREQNPYKLERKLSSFLSPEDRKDNIDLLRTITRQYAQKKRQGVEPKDMPHEDASVAEDRKAARASAKRAKADSGSQLSDEALEIAKAS